MCGILSLVKTSGALDSSTAPLVASTSRVRHRGPDDAGYLLWAGSAGRGSQPHVFAGTDTARATRDSHRLPLLPDSAPWRVALGHRRLSIVDLSPAGHQPMVHCRTGMAIAYNGEIYNHVELRRELERLGHELVSRSDTEVLLSAWAEWGPACLDRLNGMFAFVLLDPRNGGTLHAVRDRFAIKPLYWARVGDLLGFASEIKQLRSLPGYRFAVDEGAAYDYLATGLLDHTRSTLHDGVQQLLGGERAVVRLEGEPRMSVERWYDLRPRAFRGSATDAAEEVRRLLTDSVRLRLRADVPVGSCLSGGLDSSAIVCLASELLAKQGSSAGQVTVTARYEDARFDEWRYASQVVQRAGTQSVEVWPSVDRLRSELDRHLWHMDEPFGSTSQFSQWCVFGAAAEAGLKVMLDGQGSDEQLAGYSGNDGALYAGLLRHGRLLRLADEVRAFRRARGTVPIGQLVSALRSAAPLLAPVLPGGGARASTPPPWLRLARPQGAEVSDTMTDLASRLREQTLATSLPVLLRYEDRNSMAFSIESRVPFLDFRLVEFLAGLPDELRYRRGVTKVVLREALRGIVPEPVRARRDKMGFVTPEEVWLRDTARTWFRDAAAQGAELAPGILDPDAAVSSVDAVADGHAPFSFAPWRLVCFGRWTGSLATNHGGGIEESLDAVAVG